MSKLNRLQKKIADLRKRLSSLGKDDPERTILQKDINIHVDECQTIKGFIRESLEAKRSGKTIIRATNSKKSKESCSSGSEDCGSRRSSSIVDLEDHRPAQNRRCHCGCNKLFDRVTHCNVEKFEADMAQSIRAEITSPSNVGHAIDSVKIVRPGQVKALLMKKANQLRQTITTTPRLLLLVLLNKAGKEKERKIR